MVPITRKGALEQVDPPRVVTYQVQGQPVNRWTITVARGFRGFDDIPAHPRSY